MNNNIKLKISCLCLFISSFISFNAFSQIFDTEQSPLSVKWRKINTGGFQLLYPAELEKEAQRMANTLPNIYPFIGADYNIQKTNLKIILQNRGTIANGFVQLAPKKSQFYTTPPQLFDSQDWLNNLAVHELRHAAQFGKITGREKFFLTEEIHFAYLGLSTPTWLLEGDAVSTETSLTNAGRGRQPSWIMPFRTSLLSGKKFSYSKAYFGSAKDQTPGYYQLGYLLTSNLRKEFGKTIVDRLLTDINQRPLRPYPFSGSLKKFTGSNTRRYYLRSVEKFKSEWEQQDQLSAPENYQSLNKPQHYAGNYYLPTILPDGRILTLKETKGETAGFVLVNIDSSESKLFKIGYQEQPWYTYGNGKLTWDEIRYDPRYRQRSYSVICSYDLATGTKRQLTFKTRLFSPAISGDGRKLIAVQIDLSNKCTLVEVNLESGKTISVYDNPENLILQTPALNTEGTEICFISTSEKGKALWLMRDNKTERLITETTQQLSRPIFLNTQIAFNAHYSGIDNIYKIDPHSKKIVALTASKYGAFNPSFSENGKTLFFNIYEVGGYQLSKTPLMERAVQEDHFVFFGKAAADQENTGNVFDQIPDSSFRSSTYRPFAHLFNFHSIGFAEDDNGQLALQLKSSDLLNNLNLYTGLAYNNSLGKVEYQAGFSFKSFYPVFSAAFKNRPRMAYYRFGNRINRAEWRENYFNLKAIVPISFSAYQHQYNFTGEIGTSYTRRNFRPAEVSLFNHTISFPMNYRFGFTHSVRTAERDVAPRWAQYLRFSYFNRPFDARQKGELLAVESSFYFPGIGRNHSLIASFNYQTSSGALSFDNEIGAVWGYSQILARSPLQNTLLLNYRFPIVFPDAEIGSLAYIRNIRGGFFSHYENIGKESNLLQPKTFGLELRSSMNLLRYQPVVDLGARLIFVNQIYHQNPILEFTFNYSF